MAEYATIRRKVVTLFMSVRLSVVLCCAGLGRAEAVLNISKRVSTCHSLVLAVPLHFSGGGNGRNENSDHILLLLLQGDLQKSGSSPSRLVSSRFALRRLASPSASPWELRATPGLRPAPPDHWRVGHHEAPVCARWPIWCRTRRLAGPDRAVLGCESVSCHPPATTHVASGERLTYLSVMETCHVD